MSGAGKPPDAVNFWMGDERAVTSSKQDRKVYVYVEIFRLSNLFVFFAEYYSVTELVDCLILMQCIKTSMRTSTVLSGEPKLLPCFHPLMCHTFLMVGHCWLSTRSQ